MGGLWVDYNLMSTIPGLYVLGEANFSDHGANRLGASALMQGLADGYFVLPYTIGDYLATTKLEKVDTSHPAFREAENEVTCEHQAAAGCQGQALGGFVPPRAGQADVGILRHGAHGRGPAARARQDSRAARAVLARRAACWATARSFNQSLEKAGRVADFLELAELMCLDALERNESCGGHFREEYQTPEGEALRDDDALLLRRGLGVPRRRQRARAAQGAARVRVRPSLATELQMNANHSPRLAAEERSATAAAWCATRSPDVNEHMSFLEMLDVVNEELIAKGEEPIAFDHDCREGICGMCGCMINGVAHGPQRGTTVCQLHMRHFKDGDELYLEPWRAQAFPVVKDLVVDRSAFDRIIAAGGFISAADRQRAGRQRHPGAQGEAPTARWTPPPASAAAPAWRMCPNASASLFTGAKIAHLGLLPQGQPERDRRALAMVAQMSREMFGKLHQYRRMRGGLPQGDQARSDRAHESRLPRRRPDPAPCPRSSRAAAGRRVRRERVDRSTAVEAQTLVFAASTLPSTFWRFLICH